MVVMNPRRSRKSSRRKSGGRRRRRNGNRFIFKNPSLASATGAIKRGFSFDSLQNVLPIAGGAILNVYTSEWLGSKLPPSLTGGWKDQIRGVITAGAMLFIPKYGQRAFVGGMTQVVIKSLLPYVVQFTGDPGTSFGRPILSAAVQPQAALPAPQQTQAQVAATVSNNQAMSEMILD